jgi:hypothetical protein
LSRRRLIWLGLLGLLLVPLFLPVPIDWRQHPLVGALGDRVHVAMFAVLVLVLYHRGPWRGRLLTVVIVAMITGGITEIVQIAAGRSAALWDWYQDAQGAALVGCWLAWRDRRGPFARWWPLLGAVVVLASVLWPLRDLPLVARETHAALAQFPSLSDFERPRSTALWGSHQNSELRRVALADGDHVLEVTHDGDDRWPGAASRHLAWNWTGHDSLLVDVRLVAPSPDSLRISLWMEDVVSARDVDDARVSTMVGHQWTTLAMPLQQIRTLKRERRLRLRNVVAVSVFTSRRQPGPLAFQIDDIRLSPVDD